MFGLTKVEREAICAVFSHYPQVEKAILYGSRTKGNYKPCSDIDLVFLGNKDLTFNILHRIMNEIDDLLLPYTFDLSIFHHITDSDVIDHITRLGVVFYKKD